uniref:Heparan sulfate 2-O-sulfotransferase 1 n=1 Tax=Salarias fasciatus TaxID=181472 RepID=A0A672F7K2_SALFA
MLIENQIQKLDESRAKLESVLLKREVAETERRVGEDQPAAARGDNTVIIYNRVPKTASTSFTNIACDLCRKNQFHVLHVNISRNNPVLSLQDQIRFVKNITSWKEKKPGFYHGHMAYLDFAKYGVKDKPLYINVVRDPIERLVSYYYFLRSGDDYRRGLRRRKQGDKQVTISIQNENLLITSKETLSCKKYLLKGVIQDFDFRVDHLNNWWVCLSIILTSWFRKAVLRACAQ